MAPDRSFADLPGRPPLAALALLFGVACYCILSLRAELAPDAAVAGVVSLRRLVATAGGAVLFWAILRRLDGAPRPLPAGPLALLAMFLAAGAGLLLLRVAFGWVVATEQVSLAQDIRWTLLWLGYLGLSTGLYLAYRVRAAERAASSVIVPRDAEPAPSADAADWLTDALTAAFAADLAQVESRDRARRAAAAPDGTDTPGTAAQPR